MTWWKKQPPGKHARPDRVADAGREVEVSRRRLAETREQVVAPLKAYADANGFAAIIEASLTRGHRREPGQR